MKKIISFIHENALLKAILRWAAAMLFIFGTPHLFVIAIEHRKAPIDYYNLISIMIAYGFLGGCLFAMACMVDYFCKKK